jgi:hypothetical protein
MEKKRIVAVTSTMVSALLEAFGNLSRRKRSIPNKATRSKVNHASSGEFIRPNHDKAELKKSGKRREEFMN